MTLLAAGLLAAALLAPSAVAATPATPPLRVSPAAPTLKTPITVTWRPGKTVPASARYTLFLSAGPSSSKKLVCTHVISKAGIRRNARGVVTATFRPSGPDVETRKWCPGTAVAMVINEAGDAAVTIAKRNFAIRRAKGELGPGLADTPASIQLLAGSTITLTAPGRPDRASPVNGTLRGLIPSPFRLRSDIHITRVHGALVPVSLAADPLCPDAAPPRAIALSPATAMTVFADGRVSLTVKLTTSGAQIVRCGAPAPVTPTTAVTVTGKIAERGLLSLRLDGAADGVTLSLLVFVDLSDPV